MDRFDRYVQDILIPEYTKSERRKEHVPYRRLIGLGYYHREKGNLERAEELRKEGQKLPSRDPQDPEYRRLSYIRYADDFLLEFAGPLIEAEEIKERRATFLGTTLKLTLAAEKTLITQASTGRARFLGYEIGIMYSPTKMDSRGERNVNGRIGMYIPDDVIQTKRKRYLVRVA
jgi:hypothetical protein